MILDASVVFKWIRDGEEPNRDTALRLLKDHLSGKEKIIIPNFLYLEIANVLVTKTKISDEDLHLALEVLFSLNIGVYEISNDDIREASTLARKYKTSVYDMIYAVIAKKHKTFLVTADEKFIKAGKFLPVKLLSLLTTSDIAK